MDVQAIKDFSYLKNFIDNIKNMDSDDGTHYIQNKDYNKFKTKCMRCNDNFYLTYSVISYDCDNYVSFEDSVFLSREEFVEKYNNH